MTDLPEKLFRRPAPDACRTCGHPLGWHRFNTGSCLECACLEAVTEGGTVTDRSLTELLEVDEVPYVVVDHDDRFEVHFMRETYTADQVRSLLEQLFDRMRGEEQ